MAIKLASVIYILSIELVRVTLTLSIKVQVGTIFALLLKGYVQKARSFYPYFWG